jgi:hypothetical protein
LDQVRQANQLEFINFHLDSPEDKSRLLIENSFSETDSSIEVRFPEKTFMTTHCVYKKALALKLNFQKDNERAITLNVKKVSSAVGYTTLSTIFISISQTNSLYSLVGLLNTNKIFSILFIMNVPIPGIINYINKVDTLLNFDPSLLVTIFIFQGDSAQAREYIYLSYNLGEHKIKEVLLVSASLLLCLILAITIALCSWHSRKFKRIFQLLSFVTEDNYKRWFKKFEAKYSKKFTEKLQKEYQVMKSRFHKFKRQVFMTIYRKQHEFRFFLLSTYISEFSHFVAKSCVLIKNGSAIIRSKCIFNLVFWTSLLVYLAFSCSLRLVSLITQKTQLNKQEFKELILYKTNGLGVIKIFIIIFIFITLNKYFSACLCSVLVVQIISFSLEVLIYKNEIIKKNLSKLRGLFALGLEHLLTMAILYLWCVGYTFGEKEPSVLIDLLMVCYNVSRIAKMIFEILKK